MSISCCFYRDEGLHGSSTRRKLVPAITTLTTSKIKTGTRKKSAQRDNPQNLEERNISNSSLRPSPSCSPALLVQWIQTLAPMAVTQRAERVVETANPLLYFAISSLEYLVGGLPPPPHPHKIILSRPGHLHCGKQLFLYTFFSLCLCQFGCC